MNHPTAAKAPKRLIAVSGLIAGIGLFTGIGLIAGMPRTAAGTLPGEPAFNCARASGEIETLVCKTQRGWVKGRNDCWKSADHLQCTQAAYETRIAALQARYELVPAYS
jgi:uncharacterized protein